METERFERGYLEMQLNQCEKKLAKMDDDYKDALIQNNFLKKQIQALDEHDQLSQIAQNDVTFKQLHREIEEKENELLALTIVYNESKSDVESLMEKLQYAELQVKTLNTKLLESFSEAESISWMNVKRWLIIWTTITESWAICWKSCNQTQKNKTLIHPHRMRFSIQQQTIWIRQVSY